MRFTVGLSVNEYRRFHLVLTCDLDFTDGTGLTTLALELRLVVCVSILNAQNTTACAPLNFHLAWGVLYERERKTLSSQFKTCYL